MIRTTRCETTAPVAVDERSAASPPRARVPAIEPPTPSEWREAMLSTVEAVR